ncbi:hypothetical protein [Acinetobacter calcoaceticus]|uniref:hypothetical protein n=1 Tax=Acinetobacter calcoaceticus TaxID=471 RepID=UPI0002CDB610|nr:hypothetical protein [Acinetobacter calcoaceticus]ENU08669.1 hypothetical protein F997_02116 [Acinetobacter calcoaceticus NIPH 13]
MKKLILVFLLGNSITGCALFNPARMQAPAGPPNIVVQGTHTYVEGDIVERQKLVYFKAYDNALLAEGIVINEGKISNINPSVPPYDPYRYFYDSGASYWSAICTDYFRRSESASNQRLHAKRQTNLVGGLTSALLGLSNVPSATVGGIGAAFSAVDSGFDAYDNSFLVNMNLGLLSGAVFKRMDEIYKANETKKFTNSGQVFLALREYSEPCTHTGMKRILDESLKKP